MPRPRHRFQCGPSTFAAVRRGEGWWVHERWWEFTRRDDEEDFEEWHGPFQDESSAAAQALEWRER